MKASPKGFVPCADHGGWMDEDCVTGLVSVIIPTYNRAAFITEAMQSVFAQSYRPVELIVVDDGSCDGTSDIVRAWSSMHVGDARFQMRYVQQRNMGAPAARNAGLGLSRGEYIQFLDSDDVLLPDKIALQQRRLALPGADVVFSGWIECGRSCDASQGMARAYPRIQADPAGQIPHGAGINVCAGMYRRCVLRRIGGFRAELGCDEETDLHMRLALCDAHFVWVPGYLSLVRMHDADERVSTTPAHRRPPEFGRDFWLYLWRFAIACGSDSASFRKALARVFYVHGRQCIRLGHRGVAQECLMLAEDADGSVRPVGSKAYAMACRVLGPVMAEALATGAKGCLRAVRDAVRHTGGHAVWGKSPARCRREAASGLPWPSNGCETVSEERSAGGG